MSSPVTPTPTPRPVPTPVPTPRPVPTPVPVPTPAPVPSGSPNYQFWISAYAVRNLNIGNDNQNVNTDSVSRILCPAARQSISSILSSTATLNLGMLDTNNPSSLGGCNVVTPLPSAVDYVRVAYKFYFRVPTLAQWNAFTAATITTNFVNSSHTMCGSELNYQQIAPTGQSGPSTHLQVNQLTNPTLLSQSRVGPGTASPTCYVNVFDPLYTSTGK